MITLNLVQGSPEWHAHRASHHNASDASVIMGKSPYRKRSDLIEATATGVEQEISKAQQALFDKGHDAEAAARPMAEEIIGEELFPCVGVSDDGKLSASFDGLTMLGDAAWEHKLWNEAKANDVRNGRVPDCDWWQVVQQIIVSGADKLLYMVSDGTCEKMEYVMIDGDQARKCAGSLLQAWGQFEEAVANYKPSESTSAPEGVTPETLPALHVEATGKVIASNLDAYRDHAMQVLGSINRDLKTDQDFSDAEQTVKWCKSVESKLSAAKDSVLGQMASVDEVCRTIDDLSAETRRVRLDLDKLVKAEKERRKADIVNTAVESVRKHCESINASLREHALQSDQHRWQRDIAASIKGLKTLSSITDAADTAAANLKIEASQQADRIRAAVAVLDEFADHAGLFADRVQLCREKSPEDLRNLAKARVAEHEERERQRIEAERQRIRAEEQAKAERKAQIKAEAEEAERADIAIAKAEHDAATAPQMQPVDRVPPATDTEWPTVTAEQSTDERLIKLGDINKAIAPLSITAEGLHTLCDIEPADIPGRAKMYRVADVMMALAEMQHLVDRATPDVKRYAKEAA